MGEVTALPGYAIAIPDGDQNPEIVEALEELLDKARAGQIRAFAWAGYKSTDMINRGWVSGAYGFHLAAAIQLLQYAYVKQMSADD